MQKGFNLFTALVATMLVVLAVLLVQAMNSTQRQAIDTIKDIEEEQKMLAVADLAKADALQVFNFGIRYSIEEWLSYDKDPQDGIPDNYYNLSPQMALEPDAWEKIKEDFARTQFGVQGGGSQLAFLASQHITSLLLTSPDVKGYSIDLPKPNEAQLRVLLQKVFEESAKDKDFFEVIECDGTFNGCSKGTFYVNLNLKSPQEGGYLSEEDYEKFPQIKVTNNLTDRVLRQPVLPRGNLQIYVPVRLFKTLSAGLEVAKANGNGVFEQGFKQSVESARSGICDTGSCNARESLNVAADVSDILGSACFGDSYNHTNRQNSIDFEDTKYDPSDDRQQGATLKSSVEQRIINPHVENLVREKRLEENDFKVSAVSSIAGTIPVVSRKIIADNKSGEQAGEAYCTEVSDVAVFIVYEELNKNYIVSQRPERKNVFAVKLFDSDYTVYNEPVTVCRTEVTRAPEGIFSQPTDVYNCRFGEKQGT